MEPIKINLQIKTYNERIMSRFSEKGYLVKENAPIYLTSDMDRTAKWFEDTLGWNCMPVEKRL